MRYFFILGKNPTLSQAEIEAVFELESIRYKVVKSYQRILILETKQLLDIEKLNQCLGGIVKIGEIIGEINNLGQIADNFCSLISCQAGKLHFGFSLYSLADKINLKKFQQKLKPVAMEIKRWLREEKKLNSRWVVSKEPQLSSVIVKKNQLLKYGSEICLFIKDKEILIGQTLAVQQFEEFGSRDFTRPGRDDVSGMLPPKLARIMINLGQLKHDAKILDPFCGSGTILQEAIVLGYKNLIGTDISSKAVEDTKKNLNWLTEKFSIFNFQYSIINLDVRDLSQEFKANSIEAVITEPLLGPPLNGQENHEKVKQIVKDLEKLYLEAFSQFTKVLNKDGKIVIVFPIFKFKNFTERLNVLSQIEKMGFKNLNKDELVYGREKQHVWRRIFVFKKK